MILKKIELETSKLKELRTFYTEKLGFECLESSSSFFSVAIGYSILKFTEGQASNHHFAMNIPKNQLDSSKVWIKKKGINLCEFQDNTTIDFPNWNAQAVYFLDPAHNVLEFIARHDLDNASQNTFSSKSILNISEIGFSVPEVEAFYNFLKAKFDIPVYSHISNMTSFCAAGSAEGLFIIVPLERNWFPTQIKNSVFSIKVMLQTTENSQIEQFESFPYWVSA